MMPMFDTLKWQDTGQTVCVAGDVHAVAVVSSRLRPQLLCPSPTLSLWHPQESCGTLHVSLEWMASGPLKKKNCCCFENFIIPFGKFGPPYPGKATAAARAALPSPTSACWVFSCFRNPPNSDLDCRIFNVHTWSFVCMLVVYTQGLGTPTAS